MKLCVCVCVFSMHAYILMCNNGMLRTYFIRINGSVTLSNNIHSTDRHCVVCCSKKWKQDRTSSFRLITGHIPNVQVSSTTVKSDHVFVCCYKILSNTNLRLY